MLKPLKQADRSLVEITLLAFLCLKNFRSFLAVEWHGPSESGCARGPPHLQVRSLLWLGAWVLGCAGVAWRSRDLRDMPGPPEASESPCGTCHTIRPRERQEVSECCGHFLTAVYKVWSLSKALLFLCGRRRPGRTVGPMCEGSSWRWMQRQE